jgi:uncharacterized OsmC-like protein
MATTTMTKNGVDVQKLTNLIEDVKREPWKGRLSFTVKSEWKGGFKAVHTVSQYEVGDEQNDHSVQHSVKSDEPAAILGADSGISPTELILSSLASCLSVGYAANAAAMGIDLKEVRFELTGHGDLQGFMNLNDVRPGLTEVDVRTYVRSDAPREKLQELHDHVNAHSPMWDTISNPVKVRSQLMV